MTRYENENGKPLSKDDLLDLQIEFLESIDKRSKQILLISGVNIVIWIAVIVSVMGMAGC